LLAVAVAVAEHVSLPLVQISVVEVVEVVVKS
jgi:hypothetical protein